MAQKRESLLRLYRLWTGGEPEPQHQEITRSFRKGRIFISWLPSELQRSWCPVGLRPVSVERGYGSHVVPVIGVSCRSERRAADWIFFSALLKADNIGCALKPRRGESGPYTNPRRTCEQMKACTLLRTRRQNAFRSHLPSCDREAFGCFSPMNIKYKHSSKFSTPGLYFMLLSRHNKHISFPLPDSCSKDESFPTI